MHCCLNIPGSAPVFYIRAFRGLVAFAPDRVAEVVASLTILALDRDTRGLAIKELALHEETWRLVLDLMPSHLCSIPEGSDEFRNWETEWVLLLIRAGHWDEAVAQCHADLEHPIRLSQIVAFNVAMALWGRTGVLRKVRCGLC